LKIKRGKYVYYLILSNLRCFFSDMKSKIERERARALKSDGFTFKEISLVLGISYDAVRNLCHYQTVIHRKKPGTKRKITKKDHLCIKRAIARFKSAGEKVSSPKIKEECQLTVSTKTVQRHLTRVGAKYKRSKNQIVLSQSHKDRRVAMCSKWIIEDHNWNVTIFSDEKRFSMDGPDNWSSYVMPGEISIRERRQCKGGGIMVWIMTFPNGLLAYRIIRGKFKSGDYIAMLQDKLVPCMKLNYGETFYFQEDNCSVHKARIVKQFMKEQYVNVLEWPSKSPDLNIVEDVWKLISDLVYDRNSFKNKNELEEAVLDALKYVQTNKMNTILDLYKSIRKRLCTVLSKQGNLYNK